MTVDLVARFIPGPFAASTVLSVRYDPPMRAVRRAPSGLRLPSDPDTILALAALFLEQGAE